MSKKICVVCSNELGPNDNFNIHYMCFIRNTTNKPESHIKKCIVCDRTLPPKTTRNYHKKCISEQTKEEEKPFKVQVFRDKQSCTIMC